MSELNLTPVEDIAGYQENPDSFPPRDVFLVVKSQDQIERRGRLIDALARERIGRIEHRAIADGLIVQTKLVPGRHVNRLSATSIGIYREPRGIALCADSSRYISEVDRILHVSADGTFLREFGAPGFGFLHGIELSPDERRLLVVSSGYDMLMELDTITGAVNWDWCTWEHGFNPSFDGTYLARKQEQYDFYISKGCNARLVNFDAGDSYGLMTSARTNHPNSACYHPVKHSTVLATLGHSGEVIEIDFTTGEYRYALRGLSSMPHGILPMDNGWMVTNTLRGECWIMDANFKPLSKLDFSHLLGKPAELGAHEWLQCVVHFGNNILAALDANRGLILVDLARRHRALVPMEENWCVHFVAPELPRAAPL